MALLEHVLHYKTYGKSKSKKHQNKISKEIVIKIKNGEADEPNVVYAKPWNPDKRASKPSKIYKYNIIF